MRRVKFKVVRKIGERRFSAYVRGAYRLNYSKDAIVRAKEGALGVAVFGRKEEAKTFCDRRSFFKIVRVLPVGRGRTVKVISNNQSDRLLDIFYRYIAKYQGIPRSSILIPMAPPRGTMFYPAVEVLE